MENKPKLRPDQDAKLMDHVREVLRYYHYAYRTKSTYRQWILCYMLKSPIRLIDPTQHLGYVWIK